ncbi:hypothetical protein BIW11_09683 [Tropilaelaps mercedesae]|uniref:Peroxisomal biogenesis factor 3 n=1 Tax=Tropilaelaps mercedesae TaxID=418985 RepID=A0A1V9XJ28_9ACAR|nr:hypothetical protein BIW11_09683 [Tropilaelaps mercedesae]
MLSKIGDFFRRNRRKFVIGGVVIGGLYVAHRYIRYRVEQWYENQTQTMLEQLKRKQHFGSILSTSDSIVLSCVFRLREMLSQELDIETLLEKVRTKPDNRVELWEEIKVRLITYGIVSVYAESLLICALRIQLGIIGGQVLLNSRKQQTQKDQEVHKKYLEMTHHFLNQGVLELVRKVKVVVVRAFEHIELKQTVSPDDFLLAYGYVRKNVPVIENAASYLIRDCWESACANPETANFEALNEMIAETKDILQCSDCLALLENLIDYGFRDLQELVRRSFIFLGLDQCPMVKVLPALKVQTAKRGELFVHDRLASDCSKNFLANVYEAFCNEPQR